MKITSLIACLLYGTVVFAAGLSDSPGPMMPASYTFASLPTNVPIGTVVYCSNCRNVVSTTSGGISGQTNTNVLETTGNGTGALVIFKSFAGPPITQKWCLVADFNTAASA